MFGRINIVNTTENNLHTHQNTNDTLQTLQSLQFLCEHKRPQIDKANLTKKSYSEGITVSDFKT
jgi:hypothetical protein